MKELNQELEQVQEIEQVANTYYYDELHEDQHLGSFTESTQLAHLLGWQELLLLIPR